MLVRELGRTGMEQPSSPPPQQPRARLQGPKSSHHAGNAKHGMALGLSGGVAGAVAKTAVAPLERIKLLNQAGQSAGLFATLHKVMHNEGWRALWRGNTVNVIRMIPNKGILLGCSDVYKDAMRSLCLGPFWTGALSGALAGGTAIVLTYPLDLARTRMAGFLLQKGEVTQYPTLVATISAVYRTEGFRALFRGVGPTLAGSFPYEVRALSRTARGGPRSCSWACRSLHNHPPRFTTSLHDPRAPVRRGSSLARTAG